MANPHRSAVTKHCPKCKVEKPAAEFYADRTRPDKLYCHCKACARAAQNQRAMHKKQNRRKIPPAVDLTKSIDPARAMQLSPYCYGSIDIDAMRAEKPYREMMELLEQVYLRNQRRRWSQ